METVRFEELNLYPQLLRAIKEMGFEEATPIQAQAIPVVMSGVDVIGQAQTGTGKTAAFGIPLLQAVNADEDNGGKPTKYCISAVDTIANTVTWEKVSGSAALTISGDDVEI